MSVSDVDDRISSQLSAFSSSFDCKLDTLTAVFMERFSSLTPLAQANMSARMPNPSSFAAPLEVPVLGPSQGLDASYITPEGTVSFKQEFQGDGSDWVPSGFRTPFPVN